MDTESRRILGDLIRGRRTASLGTLLDGAPFVSMVLFAPSPDFSSFFILISRLALHTRAIASDPRAALMIAGVEREDSDPQTIARVSIRGTAAEVPVTDGEYERGRALYLGKYPQAAFNFQLGDFGLFRLRMESARYVAGFGRIFDLTAEELRLAAEA
jgi:heme iron utilization protein